MRIERRYTQTGGVRVESRADGKSVISGYAAVFYDENDAGTEFRLWDDIVERIKPGAFDRAIREDDVRGLFNHDPNQVLGRNRAGTLRLSVDDKGLRYEIDAPDTATARELIELIRRGDITGSSFGFVPDVTTFREEGKITIVERESVQLWDVSPVTFPAYASTSAGLRAIDPAGIRSEVSAWRNSVDRSPRDPILARARAVELGLC